MFVLCQVPTFCCWPNDVIVGSGGALEGTSGDVWGSLAAGYMYVYMQTVRQRWLNVCMSHLVLFGVVSHS